jgi:ligand-binding SRPBCC domain-containing protein
MARFETTVTVECPVSRVFDFLIVPENHERLSPPETGLRFVAAPAVIELGTVLEFKVQNWGMVQHVTHEVIAFEPGARFTEKQIKGPLQLWVHEHEFRTNDAGHAVITDRIDFLPPGGLARFLVTEAKLLELLEDGFHYRQMQLKKLLEGAP